MGVAYPAAELLEMTEQQHLERYKESALCNHTTFSSHEWWDGAASALNLILKGYGDGKMQPLVEFAESMRDFAEAHRDRILLEKVRMQRMRQQGG